MVSDHLWEKKQESELMSPGEVGCPGSQIKRWVSEAGQGEKTPQRSQVKWLTKERPCELEHLCSKSGEQKYYHFLK